MNNSDSIFFKIIGFAADILTLFTFGYAIAFSIINKNTSVTGHIISKILSRISKISLIILISVIIIKLSIIYIYSLLIIIFKGKDTPFYWESGSELWHILSYLICGAFSLSLIWIVSSSIWSSSLYYAKSFINLFLPLGHKIKIIKPKFLYIKEARYGAQNSYIDVTKELNRMKDDNTLTVKASNNLGGDPIQGVPKKLIITYNFDGEIDQSITIEEGKLGSIKPIN